MSFNDLALIGMGVVSVALILLTWRLDKERFYGVILLFLILIALTGQKLAIFFGHETNVGNIFYASIFLATYFLVERYGVRAGVRSIGMSIVALTFFNVLMYLAVAIDGSLATVSFNASVVSVFASSLRITLASLIGFIASQVVNVFVYTKLRARFGLKNMWGCAVGANAIAQIIDSAVFFTVAFTGTVLPASVLSIMITGYVIKVVFVMITAPLLYLNRVQEEEESSFSLLVMRS